MKKKSLRKNRTLIVAAAAVILIVALLSFFQRPDVTAGQKYIQEQEQLNVDKLAKSLAKIRSQELKQAQEEGNLNPFALFNDYVFFGDSRVMGFYMYGFLDTSRILADKGNTINNITDWDEQVKVIRPTNLYFSYGVNDMGLNVDGQEGGYDGVYEKQIKHVLKLCPKGAKVYVNSILPATPEAVEKSPAWEQVDDYNKKIKKMCEKNGYIYVDNDEITANGNADIYQSDGVHLLDSFYPVWAMNMNEENG